MVGCRANHPTESQQSKKATQSQVDTLQFHPEISMDSLNRLEKTLDQKIQANDSLLKQ